MTYLLPFDLLLTIHTVRILINPFSDPPTPHQYPETVQMVNFTLGVVGEGGGMIMKGPQKTPGLRKRTKYLYSMDG
jgi:hypothetical protein